ncbi:Zn-dependent exopeptidase [Lentinula aff. detonsa]|uniref:Zn-dependent exopeptidase n=1 Tax=Lentinula aff. detonsa TaxID=2804958 RepID=A0AA38KD14_9AGAR|nr:Zn-dependent exopeptidase [Lentinula aff. detonsa]
MSIEKQHQKDHTLRDRFIFMILSLILVELCLSGLSNSTRESTFESKRQEVEQFFLSVPNRDKARKSSHEFSRKPHIPGSQRDVILAKRILQFFQAELGISPTEEVIFQAGSTESRNATLQLTAEDRIDQPTAWIDVYYPELDTPKQQSVQVLNQDGQITWTANLAEEGDPLDEDAYSSRNDVPTWHYYSADGEAEGQLVYVNYGTKQDFEALLSAGVNLTGKIALARYGEVYRGIKVENAQISGAVGLLMFTDIRDDGHITAQNGYATYPHGPARNPSSVQRGSSHMLYMYPGDLSTPGYPAYQNSSRQEPSNVLSIPSIPISWKTARALIEESGLYTNSTSNKVVRVTNRVDRAPAPIWNTMASIPGRISDEVVVLGCHRDAWVLGAADPVSGTVSLMEAVRAFGALLRTGWKPLRTILFTSWDAEEVGLVGSTEFGEDFAEWLSRYAVAYLNVDISAAGPRWLIYGTPSLNDLIRRTAQDIPHPTMEGRTLWDARHDKGFEKDRIGTQDSRPNSTGIQMLGLGSDHAVFLLRLGIAASDQMFKGVTEFDVPYHYHSIYDSHRWMQIYGDPGFYKHIAVAKHLGLMALRLADSLILPLNTSHGASALDDYLTSVETRFNTSTNFHGLRKSIHTLQTASAELEREKNEAELNFHATLAGNSPSFSSRIFDSTSSESYVLPYHPYSGWLSQFMGQTSFMVFEEEIRQSYIRVANANKKSMMFDRGFLSDEGLPERPWFKNLMVGPDREQGEAEAMHRNGYEGAPFPALAEALQSGNNKRVEYETQRLRDLLEELSVKLRS